MDLNERKIELIHWISNLSNEGMIEQVEGIKNNIEDLPLAIIEVLEQSVKSSDEAFIEHTSCRNILSKNAKD